MPTRSLFRFHRLLSDDAAAKPALLHVEQDRILEILDSAESESGPVIDLTEFVACPGFVNAHLHLDLPATQGPEPRWSGGFADWLATVVRTRRELSAESSEETVRSGIAQLVASGTTSVGDISATGESLGPLRSLGFGGAVFRELIGRRGERFGPLLEQSRAWLDAAGSAEPLAGLSPHAPYSTAAEVYRRSAEYSGPRPLATHWLESAEEVEFLEHGTGPIRRFLESLGALDPLDLRVAPRAAWTEWLFATANGPLVLAHGNHFTADDVPALRAAVSRLRLAGIVHCPRTHAWFGHPKHPIADLVGAGVPVALGTDSRASSPDLSVLAEARFLRRSRGDLDPQVIYSALTDAGALVLGVPAGRLEAGLRADLAVFRRADFPDGINPKALLDSDAQPVGTMIAGVWRHLDLSLATALGR